MKKVELVLIVISIILIVTFLFVTKSVGVLLVMSIMTTSSIYIYLSDMIFKEASFRENIKGMRARNFSKNLLSLSGISGASIGICILGILFKIMRWHNDDIMLLAGSIGLLCVSVYIIYKNRNTTIRQPIHKTILTRSIPYLLAGISFYILDIF